MGTMLQIGRLPLIGGRDLRVLAVVVKGKRDLRIVIHIVGGKTGHHLLGVQIRALQNAADIVLAEFRALRFGGEGGVRNIQAGIHHGNGHALAGELAARSSQCSLEVLLALLVRRQRVGAADERTADAGLLADGLQILAGGAHGETVEEHRIRIGIFHMLLRQRTADPRLHGALGGKELLLHGGDRIGGECDHRAIRQRHVLQFYKNIDNFFGVFLRGAHPLRAVLRQLLDERGGGRCGADRQAAVCRHCGKCTDRQQ